MLGLLPEHSALWPRSLAAAELLAPRFEHAAGWFIDVGCGVGAHGTALLERAPRAAATLVDAYRPALAQAARACAPFGARVELVAGDFTTVELRARTYRAALLCDVLHVLPRAACRAVLARIASILEPGGSLLIGELAPGPRATVFALSACLLTWSYDVFDADEIAGLCREAGFVGLSARPCPQVESALFYLTETPGRAG
jgi:ubiquinone/menaquinone biosynthesis C-methylase UbiE